MACSIAISSCSRTSETSPCGPTEIRKNTGQPWVCTFSDDFDGHAVDRTKWDLVTTAATGLTRAGGCYVDDPEHIGVADGRLTLTATKLPSPAACGPFTSAYQSGLVITKHRFAQTYGRFEVRAKLPEGTGFQPALWMYPQDLAYGDRSGEIDIAEALGSPDVVAAHIHVHDAAGVDRPKGAYCHVANAAETFHTYAVEWLPSEFTFLYDGAPCLTVRNWSTGPPLVAPQPFDKPFYLILELALGLGGNAPTATTQFPGRLEIDYARAWK